MKRPLSLLAVQRDQISQREMLKRKAIAMHFTRRLFLPPIPHYARWVMLRLRPPTSARSKKAWGQVGAQCWSKAIKRYAHKGAGADLNQIEHSNVIRHALSVGMAINEHMISVSPATSFDKRLEIKRSRARGPNDEPPPAGTGRVGVRERAVEKSPRPPSYNDDSSAPYDPTQQSVGGITNNTCNWESCNGWNWGDRDSARSDTDQPGKADTITVEATGVAFAGLKAGGTATATGTRTNTSSDVF